MITAMRKQTLTTAFLLDQCTRWPALRPWDLLKALYQSVFGPGHALTDPAAGLAWLREELAALQETVGPETELLDGVFCRIHLRYLKSSGLAPETLFRLFDLSAEAPCGSAAELEEKLAVLLALAREGRLPFSEEEVTAQINEWQQTGFPACHHSEAFHAAYAPAYRVIRREFVWILPLLAAIDGKMAREGRAIVALEGGSASGKTTLATLLGKIYDCNMFHMDDFFLRPEQQTPERLAEPGGNVDRERFFEEVLLPLTGGQVVTYRRYDCHSQTLLPPTEMVPKALSIVEGAYSMHPALASHYDLSAFLRISPEVQKARIHRRNDRSTAERFFSTWIPMERTYFEAMNTADRCDLILEVEA